MESVGRLAYRYGRWNRGRKAAFAIRLARNSGTRSVLLVGVSGAQGPVENLIEHRLIEEFDDVVASGITENVEGWSLFVLADGRQLPFGDESFDFVYANAVVEHVGDEADQQRFIDEIARVGCSWIVTTPNRWFPIEAHFHSFFTHWLPRWAPRGTVTRLLGRRDLRRLLPSGSVVGWPIVSPTLTAHHSSPLAQPNTRDERTRPGTAGSPGPTSDRRY